MKFDREHGLRSIASKRSFTGHQTADESGVKLRNSAHGGDNTTLSKDPFAMFHVPHFFQKPSNGTEWP